MRKWWALWNQQDQWSTPNTSFPEKAEEPQRSGEEAKNVQWVLFVAKKFTGEQMLLMAYSDRNQHPQSVVPPSPPRTGWMRFRILGPKGQDTLRPVSVKSLLAQVVSRKGF